MQITERDLGRAAAAGVLTQAQAGGLWRFLAAGAAAELGRPRFDAAHVLWYGGALIVIAAMTLFTTEAWEDFGGGALAAIGVAYGLGAWAAGHRLWRRGLRTPGGLLVAIAVAMAPLAIFGLQDAIGWWTMGEPETYGDFLLDDFAAWIRGSFVPMELAAILVGIPALARYRFGFIAMPVAAAAWLLSMDLTPWIFRVDGSDWDARQAVSMWFGLAMIAVAWAVDLGTRRDLAFWLHLFGLVAFWSSLTLYDSEGELAAGGYFLINLLLVGLSLFLGRRAYALFGAAGIALYLGHLAEEVFGQSLLFPFALSAVGLAVIGAGLLVYRRQARLQAWLDRVLPAAVQALRPAHARAAGS